MLVKDVSKIIGMDIYVILYTRVKYSNETVIAFHTNKIPSSEFNQLVKRTGSLASKSVECLSVREDCLCVCISDVSRGDIVE